MNEALRWERKGHIAVVTLCREAKRNAMGMAFWKELPEVMREVSADDEVRAVVLHGAGPAFTVGLDLVEMSSIFMETAQGGITGRRRLLQKIYELQGAINSVEECPVPVIAAVHGWCIGGGVDLITACDIRLASRDMKLSVRETKIAIVADIGTLQRLQKVIPRGHAAELVYTGKDIDAEEAARIGLVNHLYEDGEACLEAAMQMAEEIAANSPLAVQGARQVMQYSADRPVSEGLAHVALWNTAFLHSNDLMEAMQAFMEKREPNFTGS